MKNYLVSIFLVLTIFALGVEVSAQKKTKPTPADAVRAADQDWLKVFAAKDLEKSVAFCTGDASVLAPNAPIATGKQAIGELFKGFFSIPALTIEWHPAKVEVARSGEMAYSTGAYKMTFKDAAGKTITDNGKYVTVWKKQSDGSWKVALDIFNTDSPMPSAQ